MCGHFEESILEPLNKASRAVFETTTPSWDIYWLTDTATPKTTDNKIKILADLAGFQLDKIHVTLEGNILTIEATRDSLEDSDDANNEGFQKIYSDRPEKINKRTVLPFDPHHGGENAILSKPRYNGNDGVLEFEITNITGKQVQTPE